MTALGLAVVWLLAAGLLAGEAANLLVGNGTCRLIDGVGLAATAVFFRSLDKAFDPAPPSWLFWPLLVVFWAGPVVGALWLWIRYGSGPELGGAQWGGRLTERKMRAPEDPKKRVDRMAIGRGKQTGRILAAAKCISGTVFGRPGSGKTSALLLPIAAEWQGPVVMTTIKASDFDAVYPLRLALGPVWVIAPAGLPDRETACWSPVDYCVDAKAADRMAGWLADAAVTAGDQRSAPWVEQSKAVIKGALLAAHLTDGGITAFRKWLSLAEKAVEDVRSVLIDAGYHEVASDYAAPFELHDDGIGSVKFTTATVTKVYADEEVRATARRTDFTAQQFLDQCGTIALVASEADAERFAPLMTAITASIVHTAQARYEATGKPLSPALGLLIDEAGNMFRYPKLGRLLTAGRGMGIAVFTVWHDFSQLVSMLGREVANTVLNASGLRMLLPGNADPETLRIFNTLLGRTLIKRRSTTHSSGGVSTSDSLVEADLAPTHELQQLEDFTALVQYANLRPLKVRLRRSFLDGDLVKLLASTSAPAPTEPAAALPSPTVPADGAVPLRK